MEFKIKIEKTSAALKRGERDSYRIMNAPSLSKLRALVYKDYLKNPKLRTTYYQVVVFRNSDLKDIGTLFVTRNGLGKLTYAWAEHPYNVGSPTYAVDKTSGELTGAIGYKRKDYTMVEAVSYGWKPKYP